MIARRALVLGLPALAGCMASAAVDLPPLNIDESIVGEAFARLDRTCASVEGKAAANGAKS